MCGCFLFAAAAAPFQLLRECLLSGCVEGAVEVLKEVGSLGDALLLAGAAAAAAPASQQQQQQQRTNGGCLSEAAEGQGPAIWRAVAEVYVHNMKDEFFKVWMQQQQQQQKQQQQQQQWQKQQQQQQQQQLFESIAHLCCCNFVRRELLLLLSPPSLLSFPVSAAASAAAASAAAAAAVWVCGAGLSRQLSFEPPPYSLERWSSAALQLCNKQGDVLPPHQYLNPKP